jgi:hypothetical protein
MADPNINNVKQFISDYCTQQQVQTVAEDWFIHPVNNIISREILQAANQATGGAYAAGGGPGGFDTNDPKIAIPGKINVKINPKCFEG